MVSRSKSKPSYRGSIYPWDGNLVKGWLVNRSNLQERVRFKLYLDYRFVGEFVADRPRSSLRAQGLGDGNFGFDIEVPPAFHVNAATAVVVRPSDDPLFELDNEKSRLSHSRQSGISDSVTSKAVNEVRRDHIEPTSHIPMAREAFETLFRQKEWDALVRSGRELIEALDSQLRVFLLAGRACIYSKDFTTACHILTIAHSINNRNEEVQFYLAVAHSRIGEHSTAAKLLRPLFAHDKGPKIVKELAWALRRSARQSTDPASRRALLDEAASTLSDSLLINEAPDVTTLLWSTLYEAGRYEDIAGLVNTISSPTPANTEMLKYGARSFAALNRFEDAIRICDNILTLDPSDKFAIFQKRTLKFFHSPEIRECPKFIPRIGITQSARFEGSRTYSEREAFWTSLNSASADHVVIAADDTGANGYEISEQGRSKFDWMAGCQTLEDTVGRAQTVWSVQALTDLLSLYPDRPLEQLLKNEQFFKSPKPGSTGGAALLMSRHGAYKFGGGEHFIETMAHHYAAIGFEPYIIGFRKELVGTHGITPTGFPFAFLSDSPEALLKFAIDNDATLAHGISGTGKLAIAALGSTRVRLIYGIHFWREVFGNDDESRYFTDGGAPIERPDFNLILGRCESVYANSHYTRGLVEQVYSVRLPVIYSVPDDIVD